MLVLLHVAVGTTVPELIEQGTSDAGPVLTDANVAKEAISQLMAQTQAISEMRANENIAYQNLYKRETGLGDSLLKDMKRSVKDVGLLATLQTIVDEAVKRVEQAIAGEQASQKRYETAM